MKKIGKSFSFLTKIMLVIGLLISNLSSLSIVFASENNSAIQITVVDEKLNINYSGELAEEVENVNVNVYENYTYLDDTFYYVDEFATEAGLVSNYSLTSEELLNSEGYEVASILSSIVFDGLYEVKVEITDTDNNVIDANVYSENITHESGLNLKVFDTNGEEILPENEVYSVKKDNSLVKVVAQVLSGGLRPTDVFVYEDVEYMASEVLELEFSSEMDYANYLYGEYVLPVEVKLLNGNLEEVVYSDSLNVMYESYAMNATTLNTSVDSLGLTGMYEFVSDTKDGNLYVLLNAEKSSTVLDLYNLVNTTYGLNENVSFVISNSEYEDVLSTYDEVLLGVTLEEYLGTMLIDDNTVVTITNGILTITYKVVVVADTNGDNVISSDDLMNLVDQVVGVEEINPEKSDLNEDEEVNTLDVMYLNQVIKTGVWEVTLEEVEATVDANLRLNNTDIVSGDEFTVDFIVNIADYPISGIAGLFSYDETMLELVSLQVANDWLGNSNEGKFLFLGEDSLKGTKVEDENGVVTIEPVEYVLVTATFKALKSGESNILIEELEYFNETTYMVVSDVVEPVLVLVNASDNNNLSSLIVAGQTIELVEDVLDYEITVSNDVTTIDVEALVENVAANVTSVVCPEELAEGSNTVTITVTSESGDVKVYTVVVNREAAPKEETTTQMNYTNNYDNYEEEKEEPEVSQNVVEEEVEEDDLEEVEEESNLSRIVIIILILLVIAGLIYLIFKDEDDEETKKTNKDVNRLKKKDEELDVQVEKNVSKSTNKSSNKSNNTKTTKNTNNKRK